MWMWRCALLWIVSCEHKSMSECELELSGPEIDVWSKTWLDSGDDGWMVDFVKDVLGCWCTKYQELTWQFPQEAARYFEFFSLQLLHSTLLNRPPFSVGLRCTLHMGFLTNKIARKCPKSEVWASACVGHIKIARHRVSEDRVCKEGL